jgi:taurine-pyruvate aminotransferase
MSRVYYSNSGSEANEKAFKMIRQIAHRHHGGASTRSSTATATIMARRSPRFRPADSRSGQRAVRPLHTGLRARAALPRIPQPVSGRAESYGEAAANAIEEVILREGPDTVGGLCLEPITAGGGVITAPEGYWERVQEICDQVRYPAAHR